jgi:hypothetical protein
MNYKQWWKQISFGLLSWIGPFIVSFFFINPDGTYRVEEMLFKTSMVVVSSFFGVLLGYLYFTGVDKKFVQEGVSLGLVWLGINWVLDIVLVLSGFFQMTFAEYFISIGLRYLSIPIFTIGMGMVLENYAARINGSVAPTIEESS